jgi:hypothetical protein
MVYGGTSGGWQADPNVVYTSYDYGAAFNEQRELTKNRPSRHYRVLIFVNGWNMGQLINDVGATARLHAASRHPPTPGR